jgi:hypothetical protein
MATLQSNGERIHDASEQASRDGERNSFVLWGIPLVPLDSMLLHFLAEQLTNTGNRESSRHAALTGADRVMGFMKVVTQDLVETQIIQAFPIGRYTFRSSESILYVVKLAIG